MNPINHEILMYATKLKAENGRSSSDPRAYDLAVALLAAVEAIGEVKRSHQYPKQPMPSQPPHAPTENGIGNVRMVPVPSMLLARLIDMHQDAADALVDVHGAPHRQMVEELTALLNGPSLGQTDALRMREGWQHAEQGLNKADNLLWRVNEAAKAIPENIEGYLEPLSEVVADIRAYFKVTSQSQLGEQK